MGFKDWFVSAASRSLDHRDKKIDRKDENRRLEIEYATASARRQRQIRVIQQQNLEQMNRDRNRQMVYGGLALGAGAGYLGAQAVKGTGRAVKGAYNGTTGFVGNFKQNNHMWDLLIIFSLLYYFILAPTMWQNGYSRFLFSAFLFIAVFLFVLQPSQRHETSTIVAMVLILAWEGAIVGEIYKFPSLMKNMWVVKYLLNPQVTLLWFYFAVLKCGQTNWFQVLAKWVMFLFWFGLLFSTMPTIYSFEKLNAQLTPQMVMAAENLYVETFKWYKDVIVNFKTVMAQGQRYFRDRMRYAMGDYYTGYVDEKQSQILGVFIKNLKPASTEFYLGDTVTVWGLLQAKTLEDGLRINMSCYYGAKNKDGTFPQGQAGTPYPKDIPLVYNEEQVDVDCKFGQYVRLPEGTNKVSMQADFHFETMAYLKTYWMDQDRQRSMTRNGQDPLTVYGITDKTPTARYTNGPVKIGMGTGDTGNALIAVSDSSNRPRFGITVQTNDGWKGKIKQVEELTLMVPDSMELDITQCPEFKDVPPTTYAAECKKKYMEYRSQQLLDCVSQAGLSRETNIGPTGNLAGSFSKQQEDKFNTCISSYCETELKGYKAYKLDINDKTKLYYSNIGFDVTERTYKTFSCRIKPTDRAKILGNVPIATHYLRAKMRYTYEIEESTNVNIKAVRDEVRVIPPPPQIGVKNLDFVYRFTHTSVAKYCDATKLLGDLNKCVCLVSGVINRESRGDPLAQSKKGAVGLMQVMPDTAVSVAKKNGITTYNLWDPDQNIMIGVHYLKMLSEDPLVKKRLDYMLAAYNGGTCGGGKGALCPSKDCPNQNMVAYECPINRGGYEETAAYVPTVMSYMNACLAMQLPVYATPVAETSKDTFLNDATTRTIEFGKVMSLGNYLNIKVTDQSYAEFGGKTFRVDVLFKEYTIYTQTISSVEANRYYAFRQYPFVRFKFSSDFKSITAQTWRKTAVISKQMVERAQTLSSSGTAIPDYTEIWKLTTATADAPAKAYVKAYYDGSSIRLTDENNLEFCSIPWSWYANYGYCSDDKILGLSVKQMGTKATSENGIPGYATVEFIYDTAAEHSCCKSCSSCTEAQCYTCGLTCTYEKGVVYGGTCKPLQTQTEASTYEATNPAIDPALIII